MYVTIYMYVRGGKYEELESLHTPVASTASPPTKESWCSSWWYARTNLAPGISGVWSLLVLPSTSRSHSVTTYSVASMSVVPSNLPPWAKTIIQTVDAPLMHYSEFRKCGKDSKNADSSDSNSLSDRQCSQRLSDKADPDSPGIHMFNIHLVWTNIPSLGVKC